MLAAEVHSLILAFDACYLLQDTIHEILGGNWKWRPTWIVKRSSVVAKDAGTTDKRLQIDIVSLTESYERGELSRINWMPGKNNPADALTSQAFSASTPLWRLMKNGKIYLEALGWATESHKLEKLE